MAGFSDRTGDPLDVALVPHPAVTILFDLGDLPIEVDDGRGHLQRERLVAGLAPNGARGRGSAGSFECLQIRLSPLVAHAVLGASSELGGTVVALDELWGADAARTQERLRAAGSWDERFAIAEAALTRHGPAWPVDREVSFAWGQMVAARGRVRVERLAAEVGWSRKRLSSRFGSQVGVTPKRVARLIRFDHAAHRLASGQDPALVAAESGYVDQSHLHREALAFAGMTPSSVAASPFLAVDDTAWPAADNGSGTARPPKPDRSR